METSYICQEIASITIPTASHQKQLIGQQGVNMSKFEKVHVESDVTILLETEAMLGQPETWLFMVGYTLLSYPSLKYPVSNFSGQKGGMVREGWQISVEVAVLSGSITKITQYWLELAINVD